jgi:hypothetical protein
MNVKLLRRIQKRILKHPDSYDQNVMISRDECGTTACIAGWAVLLSPLDPGFIGDYASKATLLLGLDDEQAIRLFDVIEDGYCCGWPDKYVRAYLRAKTPRGRARAAMRRIDHFIKTKGAE